MPEPVDCKYFYGDYFRGRNDEECRLLDASPNNKRPWKRKHCDTCPVPELVRTTTSRALALEAAVTRHLLRERVEVTFAVCTEHMLELDDPAHCPACEEEAKALWE
jgi:hypothetical protein